ncbi:MAG: helix-turn-helix domain-containing protein [Microcoleus sp.]
MYNNLKLEQSPQDEKEVREFLKTLRDLLGLTQDQLGILLGVTGNTISRWETGKSQPTLTIPQSLRLFLLIEQSGLTKSDLPIDDYTKSMHQYQCLSK